MKARLVLIRHGESVLGSHRLYSGHSDTALTPGGRVQIKRLVRRFRALRIDRVFSSDLARCRETAELLCPNRPVVYTRYLRELNFGRWEGLSHAEIQERFPVRYRKWIDDPRSWAPPEGESLNQLARRVRAFVRRTLKQRCGRTLALITHGGPIRVLLAHDLRKFWDAEIPPGTLITLNVSEACL